MSNWMEGALESGSRNPNHLLKEKAQPYGVSVVICCHNSARRLPATLAHLAVQEVPGEIPWEVIVIDNASTDNTAEVAQAAWLCDAPTPLRVVHEPRLGLSHARHRGCTEAKYEFVSFIDDDNWVATNWVSVALEVMSEHPDVAACGGYSEGSYEEDPPEWFDRYKGYYAIGSQGEAGDITWTRGVLWGAGMTIRKSAWSQLVIQGFRPLLIDRRASALSSGGDNELCLAFRLAGWKLWYEPRLKLRHYMPRHRISWAYFRRLYRAVGAATVGCDPYLQPLRGYPDGLTEHLKLSWQWRAALMARELALNPRRWLRLLSHSTDGDDNVLWIDWRVARLIELLRWRNRYNHAIRAVRAAVWRQHAGPSCASNVRSAAGRGS